MPKRSKGPEYPLSKRKVTLPPKKLEGFKRAHKQQILTDQNLFINKLKKEVEKLTSNGIIYSSQDLIINAKKVKPTSYVFNKVTNDFLRLIKSKFQASGISLTKKEFEIFVNIYKKGLSAAREEDLRHLGNLLKKNPAMVEALRELMVALKARSKEFSPHNSDIGANVVANLFAIIECAKLISSTN